ncbi:MAG: bifunctional 4-hydroxy-2-oxoglutarate aldolase/2-dehydro-3-deoxy-phosphogluconate aldolase [Lachnospiraceae bacterium]|jgi:2-dehydro-3-deoxyphosphogluconate aldolase/(4S)-4-hydroxy-2-oxoglutarate aldolase|nr:bifunctional 4-hydroxy-2-oxoglutarate aldolase/2-dehydro-3-deoxy-phosphogluconate aldolase [Lachnospiraceae bacterium]MCI8872887.1 bifunctional 4-hydroxy-2-oxoglutarate aldolase/2-dehydro-3-deoxy-phosphogluconate aldolase [Lachnospiraceae bacterium]
MKPTREEIIQNVYDNKIIAIVRGMEPEHCVNLARALYEGGINMVEITFNQKSTDHFEATTKAIRAISEELSEQVMVGAGTVLTKEQVDLAKEAGALYIITPSTNPEVIRYAKEQGMVTMPGAMTPSEIAAAYEAGADFVKIFPVGNLGAAYIKAVKAPMSHIPVLAVGGVNEKNVAEFIKAGAIGAGVGGNLVNAQWIQNGEFDKITALAREFVTNAKEA